MIVFSYIVIVGVALPSVGYCPLECYYDAESLRIGRWCAVRIPAFEIFQEHTCNRCRALFASRQQRLPLGLDIRFHLRTREERAQDGATPASRVPRGLYPWWEQGIER